MRTNDNITLIGMPGAGKSTLGVVLAKKLGYGFIDTDLLLQFSEGVLLSELIEEQGVEGFIERENAVLADLSCSRTVIATGGSAVYGKDAVANFRSLGTVVFLKLSLEEIRARLHEDLLARGVVMRSGSSLEDLYNERLPLYCEAADIIVDLDGLTMLEAIDKLSAALEM